MNILFSKKMWMILTCIFSTLLLIFIIAMQTAFAYAATINSALGLEPTKLIETNPDITAADTTYYSLDVNNAADMRTYGDKLCKEVEGEGLVLLRNENKILPLAKGSKISTFGNGSVRLNSSFQGARTAKDYTEYPTLMHALEKSDLHVNSTLWNYYSNTLSGSKTYGASSKVDDKNITVYSINELPWTTISSSCSSSFGEYGDSAIVVFSRDSTEGSDVNAEYGSDGIGGNYLALSQNEYNILKQLTILKKNSTFNNIVVLLNSALPVQLDFMYQNDIDVDACMWIGNVGGAGIYAVAEALTGGIIPSGRLTDTYCKDNLTSPAMASWVSNVNASFAQKYANASAYKLHETQSYYAAYVEGIYVGYRYYETRYADVVEGRTSNYYYEDDVAFPYGFGLSYAEFKYTNFILAESIDGKTFKASVDVTNESSVYTAKETVQIYVQKPYDSATKIEKSAVELVGFDKVELAPKETKTVSIDINKKELTSYDAATAKTYIIDRGEHYFAVGKNSHDALNNILAEKGYTTAFDGMDYDGDELLADSWHNSAIDLSYGVSEETGSKISNKLDEYDINIYSGKGTNFVTYVSRANWIGTFPSRNVSITVTAQMSTDLQKNKPIKEDPAAKMPTYGARNDLTLIMLRSTDENPVPYDDPKWGKLLDQMTFGEQNTLLTTAICQTAAVPSVAKPRSTDQDSPTGCKNTISGLRFPCEGIWASTFNMKLVRKVGEYIANDSLLSNFQGMYAPGINVHRTPYGGRGHEYFSEDPFIAGEAAKAVIVGMQSKGVIAYPKHYIFNEAEDKRGGVSIWLNEQSAREIYISPWEDAVSPSKGNAHALMTSFNRAGCIWTSASSNLVDGILRDEFGFMGYVITDMADGAGTYYMTTADGLPAGTDCWLAGGSGHSFNEYRDNATVCQMMREASHRILFNITNYSAAMNGISSTTKIVTSLTWIEASCIAGIVIFSVLLLASGAMLIISMLKKRNKK